MSKEPIYNPLTHQSSSYFYQVLLPRGLLGPLTYQHSEPLSVGTLVLVPLGKKEFWGVIWSQIPQSSFPFTVRSVHHVYNVPSLSPNFINFLKGVAHYTFIPLGKLLKMALSIKDLVPIERHYGLWGPPLKDQSGILSRPPLLSLKELAKQKHKGGLIRRAVSWNPRPFLGSPSLEGPVLNASQKKALSELLICLKPKCFHVHVLWGITGSGKTETYFSLVPRFLGPSVQALILVPEISLLKPLAKRFEQYFHTQPVLWHGSLSKLQKEKVLTKVLSGESLVVIGTRSSLFLPYRRLGLVVVDEEHDPAYKQGASPFYQARDMAILRAQKEGCPVVLASATPSFETQYHLKTQKYHGASLSQRYGEAQLPAINLLPWQKSGVPQGIQSILRENLEKKEQSLVFYNRRGYAPLAICGGCGHRPMCPHCAKWLTLHLKKKDQLPGEGDSSPDMVLRCHYCGFRKLMTLQCESCQETMPVVPYGFGVERLWQNLSQTIPEAKIAVCSSDTLTTPKQINEFVEKVLRQEVDIIIGTQMISKGHHFPHLTCVVIWDDTWGEDHLDPRLWERLYQTTLQVAGRAGRGEKPGKVYVHTQNPEAPWIKSILRQDRELFFQEERKRREELQFSPFYRWANLTVRAPKDAIAHHKIQILEQTKPLSSRIQCLGPSPAPTNPLGGSFRWRYLIKSPPGGGLQSFLSQWIGRLKSHKDGPMSGKASRAEEPIVKWGLTIDIDPYDFF